MSSIFSRRYDVNPGPARWDRAKANAEKNPNSHGAKKYRARIELASALAPDFPDTPYAVMRNKLPYWQRASAFRPEDWRRLHTLCSAQCALLQAQLSLGDQASESTVRAVMLGEAIHHDSERFAQLSSGELTRDVRCFVCGATVSPDLSTSGTPFTSVVSTQPAAKADHTPTAQKITVHLSSMQPMIEGVKAIEAAAEGRFTLRECTVDAMEDNVLITMTFAQGDWTIELESVQA